MLIAVIAGVKITKYLMPVFSAKRPRKGLNKAGTRLRISRKALIESDKPNFSINNGKRGARNDEKVSCAK